MATRGAAKSKGSSLLALIKVALFSETHIEQCRAKLADLSEDEFVQVMRKAMDIGADPLKGDVYVRRVAAWGNGEGGRVNVMATVNCMRAHAEAQGDYAGDNLPMIVIPDPTYVAPMGAEVSCIVTDPELVNPDTNPMGIVYCTMGVYRFLHGQWRRHAHTVSWQDYVPLTNGRIASESWQNIPLVMIQKVCEVGALRKAYPKLGAIYIEEEMTKAKPALEGRTETQPALPQAHLPPAVGRAAQPVREATKPRSAGPAIPVTTGAYTAAPAKAEAPAAPAAEPVPEAPAAKPKPRGITILVNFLDGETTPVPEAEFANTVAHFLQDHLDGRRPEKVITWFEANLSAREQFWTYDRRFGGNEANRLKKFLEIANRKMAAKGRRGVAAGQRHPPRDPAVTAH